MIMRKGQFLYNAIYSKLMDEGWHHDGPVGGKLRTMTDDEFDKIMEDCLND